MSGWVLNMTHYCNKEGLFLYFSDLKDPGEAIPKGTLAAIGTTLLSYIVYVFVTGDLLSKNIFNYYYIVLFY